MQQETSFFYETDIHFYDCDKNGRARLETVLRYAADIAGIAYTAKGYSHQWLWEHGFVFLLSRVSLSVNRMPKNGEHIILETWEREVKGVLFFRDVIFYDENKNILVSCSTAWSLVDPVARTILKPASFTGKIDPNPDRQADCEVAGRIKLEGDFEEVGKREIVYSDIDANNHLYNAVYAGIACDFLPDEILDREIDSFKINFKREAVLHDIMTVKRQLEEGTAFVTGELEGKTSFECVIAYKNQL